MLTKKEKDTIRKNYGNMSSPLYQTVAKLHVCPQSGTRWQDTNVWGAIVLVVDRSIKPPSYLIQILDLHKFGVLFSQELYVGCVYNCGDATFHSFEVDSGFVGFAFADAAEAKDFGLKVLACVPKSDPTAVAQAPPGSKLKVFLSRASMATGIQLPGVQQGMTIGSPTGFVHKQHIGYDPAKGFECTDIPEQWKAMFRSAGIKKADMQNPEKAAVIYSALQAELGDDFLEKPPPEIPLPASPPRGVAKKKAPPIPKRTPVPEVPEAPEAPEVPEAPEAPDFSDAPEAPPPPDAPEPPSAFSAPRTPVKPPSAPGPVKPSPRGGLLADISKGGFQLKKVADGEEKGSGPPGRPKAISSALPPNKVENIMSTLTQAMGERFKAVQEDDGADDADDWSD